MKRLQWTKLRRQQVLCLAAAAAMFVSAEAVQGQSGVLEAGNRVARRSYGQGEEVYHLVVDGLNEKGISIELPVREREYTMEEADEAFLRAFEHLLGEIVGENDSLEEVRRNLYFPTWLEEYGMKVSWQSGNPQLLDSLGQVNNQEVSEDGQWVELSAALGSGTFRREYSFQVKVLPPIYSQAEQVRNRFLDYLKELDESQRAGEFLTLPENYEGLTLTYREEADSQNYMLLLLGAAAAVMLPYGRKAEEKKKKLRRERQMLLDYSEIVSKLTVYLGAGMGTKSAWQMVSGEYEAEVKAGRSAERFAYEEMCRACYQMESGMPEGKAYMMFGESCGLRSYQKLAALLEQNIRTGTRGMRRLLEEETANALEQRKDLARRQGEEAATRLLAPLFLMLGIVMVIIVVPAWMSFQF